MANSSNSSNQTQQGGDDKTDMIISALPTARGWTQEGLGSTAAVFDDALEMFCSGVSLNGPHCDYEMKYLNTSRKYLDRIFTHHVKILANFIWKSFITAEEEQGVVEGIVSFCSFDKLSNLEVNRSKTSNLGPLLVVQNKVYFRKVQVGDWKNYIKKKESIDQISYRKFRDTGLLDLVSTL
uniref:Sulfotransferase n=1 Tax=Kalanchoe fedtschenkoi TaxID=63787 RepID=A0A7N0TD41_KALFE